MKKIIKKNPVIFDRLKKAATGQKKICRRQPQVYKSSYKKEFF